ncbi:Non-reducing polyketide synthase nvfA [Labeo rohita]|uniref:Non-reducing polyketide synthase nvfA n=1 Tax=Labeo rohita TaxID=84645 RepID=A0ABQ8LZT7_LABRO|nr:Non-reducing polyketide synthase nvfA [Labeo rohita]
MSSNASKGKSGESRSRYRLCVPPCKHYITSGDTHSMRVKTLFEEGAFTSVPHGAGPASAEAERLLHLWGSQLDLLEGMKTGDALSPRRLEQAEPQRSKLDEHFLRSKPPPPCRSLPFFPDLHAKVSRLWVGPFSARLFIPALDYYGKVTGLGDAPGGADLGQLSVPQRGIFFEGYMAAAYQADLLEELDEGKEVDVSEVLCTADLALHTTKETARAIGRSMSALVAVERHHWLTLSDMKEKDRVFLRFLACLAMQSILSSAGTRRRENKWWCSSGTSLAALWLLGLLGMNPNRVPAPCTVSRGSPRPSAPDGPLLQDTELPVQSTPEASIERLVPLVDYLAAWELLPNMSLVMEQESLTHPAPLGVKAHSTQGMAASKALLAGTPMQDICNALHPRQGFGSLVVWASRSPSVFGHSSSS